MSGPEPGRHDRNCMGVPVCCCCGLITFGRSYMSHIVGCPILFFTLKDYIDLVDWTGRAARADKRGFIPDHCPPVVNRLGLDEDQWLVLALDIQKQSLQAIGGLEAVQRYSQSMGKRWLSGQRNLARAYRSSA